MVRGAKRYKNPERESLRNQICSRHLSTIERIFSILRDREIFILRLRWGIGMERRKTLQEIATLLSVTRTRIMQIEARAIRKLKHPGYLKKFNIKIKLMP